MTASTVLFSGTAALGEGPAWDAAGERILWTDLRAGALYAASLDDAASSTAPTVLHRYPETLSAVIPRLHGGYALCAHTEIVLIDAGGREQRRIEMGLDEGMRLSDACATPSGDILVGEVDESLERTGRLLRVDALSGTVSTVLDDVGFANGIGFSPDGTTLHFVDSARASVSSYDYLGAGSRLERSQHFTVPTSLGTPDGLAVDAEGALWIALFGGGAVLRFAAGSLRPLDTISLPVQQVSSCAFVGDKADLLVITTALVELTPTQLAEQPGAGSLFCATPGVRGAPVWECAL